MNHKSHYSLPFSVVFLLIFSCSTGKVTLSVLEPSRIYFPVPIKSLSIFPQAGVYNPRGVFDSIDQIRLNPQYDYNQLKRGYAQGLYDALLQSPRFSRLVLTDTSLEKMKRKDTISWDKLDKICRHDSTEAVLIFTKAVSFESAITDQNEDAIFYRFYIMNITKSMVIVPSRLIATEPFEFMDINQYEQEKTRNNKIRVDVPGILYDACYNTGYKLGTYLSPQWNDTVRYIYRGTGNKQMRLAYFKAMHSQWNQASRIWYDLSELPENKVAAKASFNLAVAWETADDLDQAFLWAARADSLNQSKTTIAYRNTLATRIDKRKELDLQMGDQ